MTEPTEAEELGAGVLDYLRGLYPVADDMPTMYHKGALLAKRLVHGESARQLVKEISGQVYA